jgi:hypothetical protein
MKGSLILMVLVVASFLLRMHDQDSNQQASKVTASGSADASFTEDLENFRHDPASPANTFAMYEKRIKMSATLEIDGNRKSTTSTKTDLPKADQGEYDRITLTPGNGKLGTFKEDAAFYSGMLNKLMTLSSEHEIQLVDGTWDDYRNGKDVKFVASPRGIEQIKSHWKDVVNSAFAELSRSALTQELQARGVKNASFSGNVEAAQVSNDVVTANLSTVKIHDTDLTRVMVKYRMEGARETN